MIRPSAFFLRQACRAPRRSLRRSSRGFTLIEMLVSLAITMMMMGAAVTLFQNISDSVSGSRSIIEMSDRLRATRNRLQADLIGATATMTPPLRPENDEGYFEYIEGPDIDSNYTTGNTTMFGDADDVLMFTVRSRGEPFIGMWSGTLTMESQCAEVIYFCAQNGPVVDATATPPLGNLYTLYRRVLLISPDKNLAGATIRQFFNTNDLSARFLQATAGPPPTYTAIANTLGDLTKRENRFAHWLPTFPGSFPFNVSGTNLTGPNQPDNAALLPLTGTRLGDDVLLTNVLSFDVQVYDQLAPIKQYGPAANPTAPALVPSDPGYASAPNNTATGAYVDFGLSYATSANFNLNSLRPILVGGTVGSSKLQPALPVVVGSNTPITYDTWSLHYENDGILQNNLFGNTTVDRGTNGLDDVVNGSANGIVDDATEFETQAPFAGSLRGIKVTIRVYDPASQQVRQVEVVQDFLPE